jgi:peptidoglycan/xylan/chitin deacetylase (PgdA/CDA1 family)
MANLRYAAYRAGLEALYFFGVHHTLRPLSGGVGVIFTLHHVRPSRRGAFQPNRMLEIKPEFLDRLIRHLRRRGVDLVSLDELTRRLSERDITRQFAAFTFDDGYRDNLEHAWPILKRHEVPLTLYLATSFSDQIGELWWITLERVIAGTDRLVLEFDGRTRFFDCANFAGKNATFSEIYWWLRGLADERQLQRVVRDLSARYGIDPKAPCRELCMGWPEIARLAEDPLVTIGAHTVNHVMLRKWPIDVVRTEMQRSVEVIEAALGRRPRHFAYPIGDAASAGPREFKLAAELGFKTAVTTRPGILFPEHREHMTALPRVSLNGEFQALRYVDVMLSGAPFALMNRFRRVDAA